MRMPGRRRWRCPLESNRFPSADSACQGIELRNTYVISRVLGRLPGSPKGGDSDLARGISATTTAVESTTHPLISIAD
jgi:hypothetical protein